MNQKKGLIVVPACNEEQSLVCFLPKLWHTLGGLAEYTADILVIDDGSTDCTSEMAQDHRCRVVRHEVNLGIGNSLRHGYRECSDGEYEFLISMDSDGQHDPDFLPMMLSTLFEGFGLVTGSRYHPDSQRFSPPLDRDLLNIACLSMVQGVTGWQHLTDALTGFWAMTKATARFLAEHITQERYGSCLEGLVKLWYLMEPRPHLAELPHPAIYENLPTREYSPSNLDSRLERFKDHASHIFHALHEVIVKKPELRGEIDQRTMAWRRRQKNGNSS